MVAALLVIPLARDARADGFDPGDPTDTLIYLAADLGSSDTATRMEATKTALQFAQIVPAPLLVEAFVNVDRDADHRREPDLVAVLQNNVPHVTFDDQTRARAALALGNLGSDIEVPMGPSARGLGPGGLIELAHFSRDALAACVASDPSLIVQRACARAVGTGRVFEAIPTLETIAADPTQDSLLRLNAERSLSTLQNTARVSHRTIHDTVQTLDRIQRMEDRGRAP